MSNLSPADGQVENIELHTDCDWASDTESRKSVSGVVITVGGCKIHGISSGQPDISLSSCESELIAATEGMK
eukprot:4545294-Alexandrium_andersonii.AAC.1